MRYLQNIFIFYAFTQYIFGAHAACPEACADYSTRKEFTPQKQKARDPFVSRLALKESRVSFSLYAPENGPPAALHAAGVCPQAAAQGPEGTAVRRMDGGGRALCRRIRPKRNPELFQGQTAHERVPGFLFLRCEFFPCAVVRTCLRTGCMCPEYILRKCIKYEYILQITHKDAT